VPHTRPQFAEKGELQPAPFYYNSGMKRIIRRIVTIVTTETWSVLEDEDLGQEDEATPVPQLGPAEGMETGNAPPAPDRQIEDAGTTVPTEENW
jgi:hypothetical protein